MNFYLLLTRCKTKPGYLCSTANTTFGIEEKLWMRRFYSILESWINFKSAGKYNLFNYIHPLTSRLNRCRLIIILQLIRTSVEISCPEVSKSTKGWNPVTDSPQNLPKNLPQTLCLSQTEILWSICGCLFLNLWFIPQIFLTDS